MDDTCLVLDNEYSIEETDYSDSLVAFFIENGLEYSEDDEVPTDLVKCWSVFHKASRRPVGHCVLAKREGRFICDGIAVEEELRGSGIGECLLSTLVDEVKRLGGEDVYLVARAPGFFRKYGFTAIPREGAPTFFECFSCPQFGKTCHPEVMKLSTAD